VCYTYKASLLFLSLLLLPPFFTHAHSDNPIPTTPPVTFNNTPVFNTDINPVFHYDPTSINNVVGMKIHNFSITMYETIKEAITQDNYQLAKKIIKQALWERRYAIAGGSLLGSYTSISLLLFADYNFLNKACLWSRWKPDCSFADLCAIPEKKLEKALLNDIARLNCNKKNPIDIVHPLINFINSIDNEMYRIKRYVHIATLIKRLGLMKIFPTNDTKINNAKHLLERAHFIKHIFLSWLAEYNLTAK